jgi:spore germination cell wall hydrolase CwlJ-like protein
VALHTYLNYEKIEDVTKGALFFHTKEVKPEWKNVRVTTVIGNHIFYKRKS